MRVAKQTQDLVDGWFGVTWNLGEDHFNTQYFRRWAEGTSPLAGQICGHENIYQTVSFPLPFGASWRNWTLSVTAAYESITVEVASMRIL